MGKYIKGKKLPKGISQRKDDGKFMAGFVDKAGKRHQRRFDTVVEADRWLYEMRHQDEFGDGIDAENITVDEWFKFWHTELIKDLAANTRRNYAERYSKSTKAVDDLKVLTIEEQKKFLETARRSHNYYQYAFLLETGLRTGEMIALTWDDIDWER